MEVEEQQPGQDELWQTRLDDAFKSTLDEGEMILNWVIIAEVIDKDGRRVPYLIRSPETESWTAMGLLNYAATLEKVDTLIHVIADRGENDEEDEDGDSED